MALRKMFDFLAANSVSPNGLYVLNAMHEKFYHHKYVNLITEQYRLELSGHLKKNDVGKYELTNKGLMLIRDSQKFLKSSRTSKKKVPFEEWKDNIQAFNEMFPKGRRPGSSVGYRTPPKELYSRFAWFFEEYPEYDWDMVLNATEKYVKVFDENNDYTYLQSSKYFIKKDDRNKNTTSTLGSICFMITEGEDFEIDQGHHYFGP